jgi:hypothetical protein
VNQTTARDQDGRLFYGWIMVFGIFLMVVVSAGIFMSFGVFLNPLLEAFGWSRGTVSLAYSIFMLTGGICTLLIGGLVEHYSIRKILVIGGVIHAIGIMLTSTTQELWHLYVFYGVLASMGRSTFNISYVDPGQSVVLRKAWHCHGFHHVWPGDGPLFIFAICNLPDCVVQLAQGIFCHWCHDAERGRHRLALRPQSPGRCRGSSPGCAARAFVRSSYARRQNAPSKGLGTGVAQRIFLAAVAHPFLLLYLSRHPSGARGSLRQCGRVVQVRIGLGARGDGLDVVCRTLILGLFCRSTRLAPDPDGNHHPTGRVYVVADQYARC